MMIPRKRTTDPDKALKYDSELEKARWDLLPIEAVEGMLRVLLYGQRKYTVCGDCGAKVYPHPKLNGDPPRDDCPECGSTNIKSGAHNWRKGFKWSRIIAAAYRHLGAILKGEFSDEESGEYHAHHLMCCVAFLATHMTESLGENDIFLFHEKTKDLILSDCEDQTCLLNKS